MPINIFVIARFHWAFCVEFCAINFSFIKGNGWLSWRDGWLSFGDRLLSQGDR
jgi:hypothetical protein